MAFTTFCAKAASAWGESSSLWICAARGLRVTSLAGRGLLRLGFRHAEKGAANKNDCDAAAHFMHQGSCRIVKLYTAVMRTYTAAESLLCR